MGGMVSLGTGYISWDGVALTNNKDSFGFQQALAFRFKFVNVRRMLCSTDGKVAGSVQLHIALSFLKRS